MSHKTASGMLPNASGMLPVGGEGGPANDEASPLRGRQTIRNMEPGGGKVVINKASLARLVCPVDKAEAFFWDAETPGLALRAYPSGRQVWLCQYRDQHGRTRRVPLGQVGIVDPASARRAARETLHRVAGGANPALERKATRRATSVEWLVEAYLQHVEREFKPSTLDQARRNLWKYSSPLHGEAVAIVDRLAVFRLHQKIGEDAGQVQANRVLATLSAMWSWALHAGLVIGENPAAFVPRFREAGRERVLDQGELQLLWRATGFNQAFHRIVRLLLLTGCRRQEVGSMQWDEIDGDLWTIPAARMKAGRPHEVPLSALALAQLPPRARGGPVFGKGSTGFDGWTAAKRRLDSAMAALRAPDAPALPHWGLHDLRRTFSTMMHDRGLADPHIIEAVLAHRGGQSGVAGVYNRAAYRESKRAALAVWASLVGEMAGSCSGLFGQRRSAGSLEVAYCQGEWELSRERANDATP
jgi:integrase